jgi:hypothetical protein
LSVFAGGDQADVATGDAVEELEPYAYVPVELDDAGMAIAAVACESGSPESNEPTLAVSPLLATFSDAPHSAQNRLMLLFGESQTGQIREEDAELMIYSPLLRWP